VQISIWLSWCHCHSLSLAPLNPDWFCLRGCTFLVPAHQGSPRQSLGGRKMVVVIVIVIVIHHRPQMIRYQKAKTNLDFTGVRENEWQWQQLGHMQICTSPQTDNHPASHHSVFFRLDVLSAAQPTASKHWQQVKALKTVNKWQTNGNPLWFYCFCRFRWAAFVVHRHCDPSITWNGSSSLPALSKQQMTVISLLTNLLLSVYIWPTSLTGASGVECAQLFISYLLVIRVIVADHCCWSCTDKIFFLCQCIDLYVFWVWITAPF